MSQQPPVPPPPEEPQKPEGLPADGPSPKNRYSSSIVTGSAILAWLAGFALWGLAEAVGEWLTDAVPAVLLVGGIVLWGAAKSTGMRSVGLGVALGGGIGLVIFGGFCVPPGLR